MLARKDESIVTLEDRRQIIDMKIESMKKQSDMVDQNYKKDEQTVQPQIEALCETYNQSIDDYNKEKKNYKTIVENLN